MQGSATQPAWVRDWQRAPRRGRFAIANRTSPSPTPPNSSQRLVQCRTGRVYTGSFANNSPRRASNVNVEILQTREYIMRTCARYEGQRAKRRDKHRELTLPERLGGLKGALTEFIKDSFTSMGEKYTLKISRHSSKSLNYLT